MQQLATHGRAGLKKAGRAGRPPRLTASQRRQLERALQRGPEALGYPTGLWTTGRVAELIEQEFAGPIRPRLALAPAARVELPAADRRALGTTKPVSAGGNASTGPPLKARRERHRLHR
ncbi:helix-turn-helix domain-containing protein [bacterium]|nr:helix-turn-helix domain-containing protein [bacterium]